MSPDEIRARLQPLLEAITAAAQGWTVAVCTPEGLQTSVLTLLLDCCSITARSIADLLLQGFPERGQVLVICSDGCPDGGADEVIAQVRELLGAWRCHFLVILPAAVAQERLERIWRSSVDALVCPEACGDGQMLQAVLLVLRGQSSLDPGLRQRLQDPRRLAAMAGTPLDLSPRERELILAVARGHSSVQIAALQQVRSDSIRRSLSALYRKVGVRNQRGLVAWGLEQGLLRPPDLHAPLRPPELAARGNGHRSLAGDR